MLCRRDYAEHVVSIFAHQIQSECYRSKRYVSIEVITLEHFSATDQETYSSSSHNHTQYAVFCSFLSDNSKKYGDTKSAHIK